MKGGARRRPRAGAAGWRAGLRAGRLLKAARQRFEGIWPQRRAGRLGLAVAAVLLGGGVVLALLPAREQSRPAGPAVGPVVAMPEKRVEEAALRPPPAVPPPARATPAWLRFAVPAPPSGSRPLVAIVLDDLGLDQARTARAIRLAGPVTLSFMTYAEELSQQTGAARRAGHELLLHVPMEALDPREDPGPRALYTRLSRGEILERLRWGLGRFDGYIGINNHMGSRFTADAQGMAPVIEELRARGLAFLDSRTTAQSAGLRLAAADGVPHAGRDVFLDDDPAPAAVAAQLARVEEVAHRRGSAIAIGHAHDPTLAALRAWLPRLAGKGLVLVPVSAIVRRRMAEEGAAVRNASTDR